MVGYKTLKNDFALLHLAIKFHTTQHNLLTPLSLLVYINTLTLADM